MTRLMLNEQLPKTKTAFIAKMEADHYFRARAELTGFKVLPGNCLLMPNGKIAGTGVL